MNTFPREEGHDRCVWWTADHTVAKKKQREKGWAREEDRLFQLTFPVTQLSASSHLAQHLTACQAVDFSVGDESTHMYSTPNDPIAFHIPENFSRGAPLDCHRLEMSLSDNWSPGLGCASPMVVCHRQGTHSAKRSCGLPASTCRNFFAPRAPFACSFPPVLMFIMLKIRRSQPRTVSQKPFYLFFHSCSMKQYMYLPFHEVLNQECPFPLPYVTGVSPQHLLLYCNSSQQLRAKEQKRRKQSFMFTWSFLISVVLFLFLK